MKNDNQKNELLYFGLKERYNSIHKIRDRVQNVGVWSLGLLLSSSVWLLINDFVFTDFQKILTIAGVCFGYYFLRHEYLKDLQEGFCSQQKVAVNIEKLLGYYSPSVIHRSKETIYPIGWSKAGSDESSGKFFKTTFVLLKAGTFFLLLVIILNGIIC